MSSKEEQEIQQAYVLSVLKEKVQDILWTKLFLAADKNTLESVEQATKLKKKRNTPGRTLLKSIAVFIVCALMLFAVLPYTQWTATVNNEDPQGALGMVLRFLTFGLGLTGVIAFGVGIDAVERMFSERFRPKGDPNYESNQVQLILPSSASVKVFMDEQEQNQAVLEMTVPSLNADGGIITENQEIGRIKLAAGTASHVVEQFDDIVQSAQAIVDDANKEHSKLLTARNLHTPMLRQQRVAQLREQVKQIRQEQRELAITQVDKDTTDSAFADAAEQLTMLELQEQSEVTAKQQEQEESRKLDAGVRDSLNKYAQDVNQSRIEDDLTGHELTAEL